MTQSVLLPPGPFTRRQAQAVTTTYSNITLEDDQGSHFEPPRESWRLNFLRKR